MSDIKFEDIIMQPSSGVRERSFPTKIYTLYLDDEIGHPSLYRDHMEVLESANEWDDVRLVISCPGGRLDSGLMLIDGIRSCRAPVTAHIHDQCGSMATGIALAATNWMLGDFAYFFVHTASWGAFGKDSEIRSQVHFKDKRIDKFLHDMYDGFLTTEEIALVSKGQDMWIDAEDLKSRLESFQEYRDSQGCNDPECEGCNAPQQLEEDSFSLDDVIAEAVDVGITKAMDKLMKKYSFVEKEKVPSKKTAKALEQAKVIADAHKELDNKLKGD